MYKCSSFNGCDAPLCPLSEDLDDCVWYPDEQVCMATKFTKLHWVRIQKRLRKYKVKGDAGYFTRQMLDATRRCTKTTRGINPDSRKAREMAGMAKDTKETPIPLPRSYKTPLKSQEGHCGRGSGIVEGKEKQLVLIQ